jgi:hypothetical protein
MVIYKIADTYDKIMNKIVTSKTLQKDMDCLLLGFATYITAKGIVRIAASNPQAQYDFFDNSNGQWNIILGSAVLAYGIERIVRHYTENRKEQKSADREQNP